MQQRLKKEAGNYFALTTNKYKYTINAEDLVCPIGKGAFATVYRACTTKPPTTTVAIKQISKAGMPLERIMEEVNIISHISEKNKSNVMYMIDWCEDQSYVYIVIPYCDSGTLTRHIYQGKLQSELEAIEYFRQICFGVNALHSMDIIHRDLKTDNIMMNSYNDPSYPFHNYVLISDYGLSKEIKETNLSMTLNIGTPITRAPEVYSEKNYSYSSDIYSLGCILYKMLSNSEFLLGNTVEEIITHQKATRKASFKSLWKLSELTLSILEGCLQYDQKDRITMAELVKELDLDNLYQHYKQMELKNTTNDNSIVLNGWPRKCLFKKQQSHINEINNASPVGHLEVPPNVCELLMTLTKNMTECQNQNAYLRSKLEEVQNKCCTLEAKLSKVEDSQNKMIAAAHSANQNIYNEIQSMENKTKREIGDNYRIMQSQIKECTSQIIAANQEQAIAMMKQTHIISEHSTILNSIANSEKSYTSQSKANTNNAHDVSNKRIKENVERCPMSHKCNA